MAQREICDFSLDRRRILQAAVLPALISVIAGTTAWAQKRSTGFDQWEAELLSLNAAVRSGSIKASEWLRQMDSMNRHVELKEITSSLNIEAATSSFNYATGHSEFADIDLPALGGGKPDGWMVRAVGNREGSNQVPHVHNQWVEAHLVVAGSFRARTYDRLRDMERAVVLKPTQDINVGVGDMILASDERDNCHWLVANSDRAMNICITVFEVPSTATNPGDGVKYKHFFVDPTGAVQDDGSIVAPALSLDEALKKFG